jgi:hypothetical protein
MLEQGGKAPDITSKPEIQIEAPERGLIFAYREEKHKADIQNATVEGYRRTIVERSKELVKMYHEFTDSIFSDENVSPHEDPFIGKKSPTKRRYTETYKPKTLIFGDGEDSKTITIKYRRKTLGLRGKLESEKIEIEYPGISLAIVRRFKGVDDGDGQAQLEMIDADTIQFLTPDGEPHIVYKDRNGNRNGGLDILDAFKDIFVDLRSAKEKPQEFAS